MVDMTHDELDKLVEAGVEKEKLKILIEDFRDHKGLEEQRLMKIDNNVAEIFSLMRAFPGRINDCKDSLESDIHSELEKHYATDADMRAMGNDFNHKIDAITGRFKWTMMIVGTIAGMVHFTGTMIYMSYQIAKVAGGG